MDKQDNPYLNLLQIMQNQSPTISENFVIGVVVNSNPLSVKVADNIVLDKDDMLINESLLSKSNNASGNVLSQGNLSSFEMPSGKIEALDESIRAGDKVVLLLSQDQQQFVLLCKVR